MAKADFPDLAEMLGKLPDDAMLQHLRDEFTRRATRLAREDDPESKAWGALYHFLVANIEVALIQRATGLQL